MPVGRTAIEKDVYVVDLEEVGEREVPCRVSAACERSERDHEGCEGREAEEQRRRGTIREGGCGTAGREAEKRQRTIYPLFQRGRPLSPLHHHSSTTSAAMGMTISKALTALFGKKEMRASSWNPHY